MNNVEINKMELIDLILFMEQLIDNIENPQNSNEFYKKVVLENAKNVLSDFKNNNSNIEFYEL